MRVINADAAGGVKIKMRRSPPEARPAMNRQRRNVNPSPVMVKASYRGSRKTPTPGNWQRIAGMFRGRDVVIVGGGGSLCGFRFDRLRELDAGIIAINNSIMDVPAPDLMVSADVATKRTSAYRGDLDKGVRDWGEIQFNLLCCWPGIEPAGNVSVCQQASNPTPEPGDRLFSPLTGVGAITAAKWGMASRIFLLGIDNVRFGLGQLDVWLSAVRGSNWYQQDAVDATEQRLRGGNLAVHYFSAERGHPADGSSGKYTAHHRAYEKIKNWKMDVVNLSPIAAVPQFPLAAVSELDKLILK